MQRYIDELGYFGVLGVATEAMFRVPQRNEPESKFADDVWKDELPSSLAGKTYAITGTSRGMGFAIAKRIAERGGYVY